ncbi:MAG: hypothetical protein C0501_06035 [Isosphaera sp.]|nr:hypothetical protein [Isosphaera sp.]
MRKRIAGGLAALSAGLVLALGAPDRASAQKDKDPKAPAAGAPKFLYGHDLRVRKGGVPHFDKDTPRVGVEVFEDEATKAVVGISEAGAVAVVPAGPVGADKTCKWLTAHDLSARKAGEKEFTQATRKYGVELFRDQGSNRLLYVCETGSVAFAPVPAGLVTTKGPNWHHGLEPKVRAPDQTSFDPAKMFGMEVFKDDNTGGLIYITETGGIATAPAPAAAPEKSKIAPPKTAYGLVLRVRRSDEPDFTDKTKRVGVEVFEDPNAGGLLFYITEAGSVATAPKPANFADARGVTWKSAMALKARKGGEKEFDKAKKYGIEVFQDNRTGHLIFITETGSIAVLPKQG